MGFPSLSRSSFFFRCDQVAIRPVGADNLYRVDTLSDHVYREVLLLPDVESADTILVQLFDESGDEEIALERGELDVGVFWPGELSGEMRHRPRWTIRREYRTPIQVMATRLDVDSGSDLRSSTLPDPADFATLDRDVFRGDLGLWVDGISSPTYQSRFRYEVDPTFAGRRIIERHLNSDRVGRGRLHTEPLIRLFVAVGAQDSLGRDVAGYLMNPGFPFHVRFRGQALQALVQEFPQYYMTEEGPLIDAASASTWRLRDSRSDPMMLLMRDSAQVVAPFTVGWIVVSRSELRDHPFLSHDMRWMLIYHPVTRAR